MKRALHRISALSAAHRHHRCDNRPDRGAILKNGRGNAGRGVRNGSVAAVRFSRAIPPVYVAGADWWPVSVLGLRAMGDRAKRPVSNGGADSNSANLSLPSAGRPRLVRRNFNRLRGISLQPQHGRGVREREVVVHRAEPSAEADRQRFVGSGDDRALSPTHAMDGSAPPRRTRIAAMSRRDSPTTSATTAHPRLASAWSVSPARPCTRPRSMNHVAHAGHAKAAF